MLQERLRAIVRTRVGKRTGQRAALARAVGKANSWVTFYLDPEKPTRHANLDTAFKLMRFCGITPEQLLMDAIPLVTEDDVEIRALWRKLGDDKLRAVIRQQIEALLPLAPPATGAQSASQSPPVPSPTTRRSSGKPRGA